MAITLVKTSKHPYAHNSKYEPLLVSQIYLIADVQNYCDDWFEKYHWEIVHHCIQYWGWVREPTASWELKAIFYHICWPRQAPIHSRGNSPSG